MSKKMYYYIVKNRSASHVLYTIPEDNVRRRFTPGEEKRISYEELLHLSYQPGGRELMANFLQIKSEGVPASLGIKTEPEYYMDEKQIINLLKNGTLDQFLDCLDFAPEGVIELIKKFAVSLPLDNYEKRQALKAKTGFDTDAAIANSGQEPSAQQEEAVKAAVATPPSGRRTAANYDKTEKPAETPRRTATNYKVITTG